MKKKLICLLTSLSMITSMFVCKVHATDETENVMLATNNPNVKISAWHNDSLPTPVEERNDSYALFSNINDGNKSSNSYLELTDTKSGENESRYIEIDLGKSFNLCKLNMFRYYKDSRMYGATTILLSDEIDFSNAIQIYNSDTRNVHGFGAGNDRKYIETYDGKEINFNTTRARYIRIYVYGRDGATTDHFVELEVYAVKEVIPPVDKNQLLSLMDFVELELLNKEKYTEDSFDVFKKAFYHASSIAENTNVLQQDVDEAKDTLENAYYSLVIKQPEILIPNKVENVKAEDTDYKTITLTWDASEGATAYEVYRKAYDSEEFKLYKTVEDTTVAVTGVMTGKEYAFYVVAKNEVGAADASDSVAQATTLHGKVTLAIEQVSTAKFKLSWNAIDGATRYIIYRKRNDDKMKKVLTLGAKDLEYTTAEMPHGDYQFILKAGRYDSKDRVITGSSNTVKGSVDELAPTINLTAGSKSVKVSWKTMEGVTHYQIYRATSVDGKYTKLITTKETSYTAKSLISGKKYFFKVRGYKTYKSGDDLKYTVYTPYSTIKTTIAK